jgi:hypothetical protein
VTGVTVSMRVMPAGNGYKYLLQSVAAGDGQRSLTTPLIAYYVEKGCSPGSAATHTGRYTTPRPSGELHPQAVGGADGRYGGSLEGGARIPRGGSRG